MRCTLNYTDKLALRGLWRIKWIVFDRVIEKFKIQNLKAVEWKLLKKLTNMQDAFVILFY